MSMEDSGGPDGFPEDNAEEDTEDLAVLAIRQRATEAARNLEEQHYGVARQIVRDTLAPIYVRLFCQVLAIKLRTASDNERKQRDYNTRMPEWGPNSSSYAHRDGRARAFDEALEMLKEEVGRWPSFGFTGEDL